jgi:hypothetical protein
MTTPFTISSEHRSELLKFLKKNPTADAVVGYCAFVEYKFRLKPVLYPREKMIYKSLEQLKEHLESQGKLCRETEITIHFGKQNVNEDTTKIYVCPFCSFVIGNNMGHHPVDEMYLHLSKCKQNTKKVDGLPSKTFLVSDDLEMIKGYITQRKAAVKKTVYTSVSGKLFNSKKAAEEDFMKSHFKPVTLAEVVYNPKEFEIEESLYNFKEEQVTGEKIEAFLEALSKFTEFETYVKRCQEGE